ncbi:hypothetical protein [Actinophytocola oryzae]|uniref:Uncharacterized protein n=1 Tax=Actinophytocola oryzae TaxID=502181 RepID=A0A4R7UP43_9PSEU|nr:hypothetical protein [Actinophytocola oryzae]TDV35317.1 hypothetical protein CLV71_13632 [Actinophytocola oryzae]
MTTPTTDMSPSQRRSSLPWVIAGAVVVVAAVAVTLVLTTGGDDESGAAPPSTPAAATTSKSGSTYDLGTPETAAESFAAAAKTGSGETLLGLACVGRPSCVAEHAPGTSQQQVAEAQDAIREGALELAQHLEGATFGISIDGAVPDTKDVPYRTPEMTGDAFLKLTFVQTDGDWLYFLPAS